MSKKKFGKKHHFVHRDPEPEGIDQIQEKATGAFYAEKVDKKEKKISEKPENPKTQIAVSDFKKNLFIIGIFIVMIIVFYFIQIKTEWLKPLLNKFGL